VSDAGTPAVSDPGALLVAAAHAAGHRCIPLPGASSAIAALSVAGDAQAATFRFLGFLPNKGQERQRALAAVAASAETQVLFEAPHRIESLAADLAGACGARPLTVCRELTKQFESVATMPASEWPAWLAGDAHRARGEFVVVVHGRVETPLEAADEHDAMLGVLLEAVPLKQAVSIAARLSGASRNHLYERALAIRRADPAASE
jgi:16S rRNA (cytidine1402-2'-O)-methyltransferase